MPDLPERARAYLEALEADRLAALAVSEQKAEEAKLIKARQEGFREALKIIGEHVPITHVPITNVDSPDYANELGQPHAHRGTRRNIRELITRELSFSAQPMTARQIARAIEYNLERTEKVLSRMERDGQAHRDGGDSWAIGTIALAHRAGHAGKAGNGSYKAPRDA
jgi:hypothetical protein